MPVRIRKYLSAIVENGVSVILKLINLVNVCGDNLLPSDRRPAETSKYVCGCGEECKCGSISDKEGNCVCDKPMKEKEAG
tara:strand:- start:101 stop:340 length:240 start_codon:yes stop_codon:yes gene_type:complete